MLNFTCYNALLLAALHLIQLTAAVRVDSMPFSIGGKCINVNKASPQELRPIFQNSVRLAVATATARLCFFKDADDLKEKMAASFNKGMYASHGHIGDPWAGVQKLLDSSKIHVGGSVPGSLDVNRADYDRLIKAGLSGHTATAITSLLQCPFTDYYDLRRRLKARRSEIPPAYFGEEAGKLCPLPGLTDPEPADVPKSPVAGAFAGPVPEDTGASIEGEVHVEVVQPAVVCQAVELPHLQIPEILADHSVQVACEAGYSLSANPQDNVFEVSCSTSGERIGHEGKNCQPVDCGDPLPSFGGPDKSLFDGSTSYNNGEAVNVMCKSGFVFSAGGSSTSIVCETSGKWSQSGPECIEEQETRVARVHTCPAETSFDGKPWVHDLSNYVLDMMCDSKGCDPSPLPCTPIACPIPVSAGLGNLDGITMVPAVPTLVVGQVLRITARPGFSFASNGDVKFRELAFTARDDGFLYDTLDIKLGDIKLQQYKVVCGRIPEETWWQAHKDFYSKIFKVSGAHGRLECKFQNQEHKCFEKQVVDEKMNAVDKLVRRTHLSLVCGQNGQWIEPTMIQTQSCAFPVGPKLMMTRNWLEWIAGNAEVSQNQKEVGRVLTAASDSIRVQVQRLRHYDAAQLWSFDKRGLIRSAQDPSKCLTAYDGNGKKNRMA